MFGWSSSFFAREICLCLTKRVFFFFLSQKLKFCSLSSSSFAYIFAKRYLLTRTCYRFMTVVSDLEVVAGSGITTQPRLVTSHVTFSLIMTQSWLFFHCQTWIFFTCFRDDGSSETDRKVSRWASFFKFPPFLQLEAAAFDVDDNGDNA